MTSNTHRHPNSCSLFGGLVALATMAAAPALAGPCDGVGVALPDGANVLNPATGGIGCAIAPGGTFTYDGTLHPAVDLGAPSGTTTYIYDAGPSPRLTSDTEPSNRTTTYVYDDRGLKTSTDPAGTVTTYTYDPGTSRLKSESDTQGHMITYTYYDPGPDGGKLKTATDPGHVVTTYTYYDSGPSSGLLKEETDTTGRMTMFIYDTNDRLTETTRSDGTTTTVYDYTYDPGTGRMTQETTTNPDLSVTMTIYDYGGGANPLQTDTDPLGNVTRYFYDGLNRVTSDGDPGTTDFIYTAEVPEPGSLALLAVSLAGLVVATRRPRAPSARA